ncbi:MAG: NitT/TauT family transport system substrate-binding protein, partial [Rhodospirillaceae bacterium]|nr:NitT/TauT family transport system substrate-binding protein [Rhodospirillaceae bacterium]
MRTPRRLLVAGLVAALALLVAACGGGSGGSGSGGDTAAAASPITIGYSAWPGWFPLAVAEAKGFFAKAGVDVKLRYFTDYTASIDALNAGRLDANTETLNDLIAAAATGVKLKIVINTDFSAGNDEVIVDRGITSVAGLRGKTIAAE